LSTSSSLVVRAVVQILAVVVALAVFAQAQDLALLLERTTP
jgi:hypothetical protein